MTYFKYFKLCNTGLLFGMFIKKIRMGMRVLFKKEGKKRKKLEKNNNTKVYK